MNSKTEQLTLFDLHTEASEDTLSGFSFDW